MINRLALLALGLTLSGAALAAEKKVYFTGDFESGRIQSNGALNNGFYIGTLPNPQSGDEILVSGKSDFGPSSNADTRVVESEYVGGETVRPRAGRYFLRSEVFRTKNYMGLNGNVRNKPRSKIALGNNGFRFDFDREGYAGFSIYVPKNFEHELGVRNHRGESALFGVNTDASSTLVHLGVWVESPATEAHWFLKISTSDTSTLEKAAKWETIDLGPVRADIGKWTDFVFRYRFNPFSVETNPARKGIAKAKDQVYQGNKGILQVWKAEGAADSSGNREMTLKVNRVNTPVGLVPHSSDKIQIKWAVYKYGWIVNPTTLTHPVWFGFDEIRFGLVDRDGTQYADVMPAGSPCTSGCGTDPLPQPQPPASLVVD
jgi:hypothetical protein